MSNSGSSVVGCGKCYKLFPLISDVAHPLLNMRDFMPVCCAAYRLCLHMILSMILQHVASFQSWFHMQRITCGVPPVAYGRNWTKE